jgi:hypothetical protein
MPAPHPWITTALNAGPIPGTTYDFTIPGLTASTVFQYRSYMIVCGVEYFGDTLEIATLPTPTYPPTVSTCAMTAIGQTTATGNGLVSSDGGSVVTARGSAWNTAPTPTIADSHTVDGSGTGTFVSSLTGLVANTTYYIRAYATNANGTSYGNEVNFMTLPIPPPPTLTVFLEACTDCYNMVLAGAFCLVCCNGNTYSTIIIGSPYANQISKSCTLNGVPAGCYYVDYDGVQLWCCSPTHIQVSISGVNWSDDFHPSCFYQCCTACFDTDNSVYGCIY